MTTTYPLPDDAKVMRVLGLLFDGLAVKPGGTFNQTPTGGAWFGVFVSDAGVPVALCGADINLAANLSAAFSMLSVALAKESIKSQQLTPNMIENLHEIMNICTRLVMDNNSPHLRLEQVFPIKSLPAAAMQVLTDAKGRREFDLNLPKYGGGILTFMSI